MNSITKARVEKILASDIQSAKKDYNLKRNAKLIALKKEAIDNPSNEIRTLMKAAFKANNEKETAEKALNNAGYLIKYKSKYDEKEGLSLSYCAEKPCAIIKEINKFNEVTMANGNKLDGLMRSYLIKIYANSTEMETLFEQMVKDIKKILE